MTLRNTFTVGCHLSKRCVIFGCGNPLFGDDGFGARVIELLQTRDTLPPDVACLDAGTAVRDFLFDMLLSPQRPEQIIIVDAMDLPQGVVGEIYEIDVDRIHPAKISDFSLHQFPTTNMLKEIQENTDIRIHVLVAQSGALPDEVRPGLSGPVAAAVPRMCDLVMTKIQ